MTNGIPVCIECGGPTNDLNEDEDGEPCPACSERLLETLPGVFHAPWGPGAGIRSTEIEDEEPVRNQESEPKRRQNPAPGQGSPQSFEDPREPA